MTDRKDKTPTLPTSSVGSKAQRSHLILVVPDDHEVFEDDLMPWDDEGLSAGSPLRQAQGSGVDLESARLEYGLTMKQAVFCSAMLRGVAFQADAYKEAYDCENMSAASIHKEATALMKNPKIARFVRRTMFLRTAT